ncbi:MAG: hypothetical protein C0454_08245 [Parvibaculum sp.]|nr:hypothetical protein [Parvibaculum sp.]
MTGGTAASGHPACHFRQHFWLVPVKTTGYPNGWPRRAALFAFSPQLCRRNPPAFRSFYSQHIWKNEEKNMRGILLWAIGVPIPIIILIYLLF